MTLADLLQSAKPGDTFDLDALGITEAGSRAIVVAASGVTVKGGTLSGYLYLYGATNLTIQGTVFDGATSSSVFDLPASDPRSTWLRSGAMLGFCGGNGWKVTGCRFTNSRCSGQLGVGDWGGKSAKNWLIDSCAFSDNGVPGLPCKKELPLITVGRTTQQEVQLYIHGITQDPMGGLVTGCTFTNSHNGEAVKLGGVDPWNGNCIGVDLVNCQWSGHHDYELKLVSHKGTIKGCTSTAEYDGKRGSIFASGITQTTLAGCSFPGGTTRLIPPSYAVYPTWWNGLFGLNPMTTDPGKTNASKGTWVKVN